MERHTYLPITYIQEILSLDTSIENKTDSEISQIINKLVPHPSDLNLKGFNDDQLVEYKYRLNEFQNGLLTIKSLENGSRIERVRARLKKVYDEISQRPSLKNDEETNNLTSFPEPSFKDLKIVESPDTARDVFDVGELGTEEKLPDTIRERIVGGLLEARKRILSLFDRMKDVKPHVAERAEQATRYITPATKYAVLAALGGGALGIAYMGWKNSADDKEPPAQDQSTPGNPFNQQNYPFDTGRVPSNSALTEGRPTNKAIQEAERTFVGQYSVEPGDSIWKILNKAVRDKNISQEQFWPAWENFTHENSNYLTQVIQPGDVITLFSNPSGIHVGINMENPPASPSNVQQLSDLQGPEVKSFPDVFSVPSFELPNPFESYISNNSNAPDNLPIGEVKKEIQDYKTGDLITLTTRGGFQLPYRIVSEIKSYTKGVFVEFDEDSLSTIKDEKERTRTKEAVGRVGRRKYVSRKNLPQ